jgi:uncharacterized protein YecE (DUF72 family)
MATRRPKSQPADSAADASTLFDTAINSPVEQRAETISAPTRNIPTPGLLVGTSAFTADGWDRAFYPKDMAARDYLSFYATQFPTVELDSTFYRTPPPATVKGWYAKTPPDFIFAAKAPRAITHEKMLMDCEPEWRQYLETMELLGEKLGPILLQFGYFNQSAFRTPAEFMARLSPFMERLPKDRRFAVEIRNRRWLDERFVGALREHGVALALLDQSWMPRPWELPAGIDPITADFTYVRWLGDRKGIEKVTKVWEKQVVDRRPELGRWAEVLRNFVETRRGLKIFAYANNHYAGFGPHTVRLFEDVWGRKK